MPRPGKRGLYGCLVRGGNVEEPVLMLPLDSWVSLNSLNVSVPSPVKGGDTHGTCLPGVL